MLILKIKKYFLIHFYIYKKMFTTTTAYQLKPHYRLWLINMYERPLAKGLYD
jgi:hypothetical protein